MAPPRSQPNSAGPPRLTPNSAGPSRLTPNSAGPPRLTPSSPAPPPESPPESLFDSSDSEEEGSPPESPSDSDSSRADSVVTKEVLKVTQERQDKAITKHFTTVQADMEKHFKGVDKQLSNMQEESQKTTGHVIKRLDRLDKVCNDFKEIREQYKDVGSQFDYIRSSNDGIALIFTRVEEKFTKQFEDVDLRFDGVSMTLKVMQGDIDKKFDGVEEETKKRFDGVDNRFDGVDKETKELRADIDKRFDGVDRGFDGVDRGFDGVDKRFNNVDNRFDRVDNRFDRVDNRFDRVDKETKELRADMDKRFDDVDKRFNNVDNRFDGVDKRIDSLHGYMQEQSRCNSQNAGVFRQNREARRPHMSIGFVHPTWTSIDRLPQRPSIDFPSNVGKFWRLKDNAPHLAAWLDYYGFIAWQAWANECGLDEIYDTLQQAVDAHPDLALRALAGELGLKFEKLSAEMNRLEEHGQRNTPGPRTTRPLDQSTSSGLAFRGSGDDDTRAKRVRLDHDVEDLTEVTSPSEPLRRSQAPLPDILVQATPDSAQDAPLLSTIAYSTVPVADNDSPVPESHLGENLPVHPGRVGEQRVSSQGSKSTDTYLLDKAEQEHSQDSATLTATRKLY